MNLRGPRVAVLVLVGIVAVEGGCASRSDFSIATTSTSTTTTVATSVPSTARSTTSASVSTTTLQSTTTFAPTTGPPTTTAPALVPGAPCSLGSHPDCIDPDGDGVGTYLLLGADCMATFPDAPQLCVDVDQDGIAGYPDSG